VHAHAGYNEGGKAASDAEAPVDAGIHGCRVESGEFLGEWRRMLERTPKRAVGSFVD